jgi:hypothetical protein
VDDPNYHPSLDDPDRWTHQWSELALWLYGKPSRYPLGKRVIHSLALISTVQATQLRVFELRQLQFAERVLRRFDICSRSANSDSPVVDF